MCGRFTLITPAHVIEAHFDLAQTPVLSARYNIAPTQPVAVVPNETRRIVRMFRWGLIPAGAEDPSVGNRMINARVETLAQKPSFRDALARRRCLVLADGFYEWKKEGPKTRIPMYLRARSGEPIAFAGLWDLWRAPDGAEVASCTIVTTESSAIVKPIHDRMPLVLPPERYATWLDPAFGDAARLVQWLRATPAADLEAYSVSRAVNSPDNDGPECIAPAPPEQGSLFR